MSTIQREINGVIWTFQATRGVWLGTPHIEPDALRVPYAILAQPDGNYIVPGVPVPPGTESTPVYASLTSAAEGLGAALQPLATAASENVALRAELCAQEAALAACNSQIATLRTSLREARLAHLAVQVGQAQEITNQRRIIWGLSALLLAGGVLSWVF